ncbi:unnamed protein product [Durusdinium trenchii]|uniref:Uncharacterized protein n=1 Tax=Durusdinium trenchii TaxID=1381693 RepID=A0ABP0P6U6_9DINO
MIQDLQLDQNGNFGQHLADFVLESLEKQLREVSEGCHAKQQLDSWHHSFEAARAMLRGRLALSNKLNQKLGLLSFFSDLIPCLLLHPGGDRILCQLLSEDPRSRGGLQRKCLKTLASQLRDGFQPNSNDLQPNSDRSTVICSARIALQHILEDILWPLRHARDDHVARTFEDVVTFVLDIVDNHGLFAGCYDVVTPALGASAVQALLEVIQQKLDTHPQLIQLFSKSFSHRVQGCSSQVELPLSLHVWIEWPQHDRQMMSTDLPNLLYLALCTPVGRELLKIAEGALARFHLDRASSSGTASGGISFPLVRSVAFSHLLLDEVAAIVANGQWTSEEAKNILQDLCSLGINTPEMLLFFDALVSHAGSTAAAGRALRRLLDVRSPHSNAELSDWAGALEKPERGVGEDPWDDLPVKGMPGYEDEKRRRQREDQEQERLDQLQVSQGGRHCPHCNRVIQQNGGCDQMLCGGHAHTNPLHREGCGREFFWSQARPYQPSVLETRQPPGFSAIATWLMDTDDFISDVADRAAEVALHGLAPADRRYAFANAAACVLLKRGQQKPNLAQALMSKQSLQATLGFEDPSLVPVAGMLCDASAVSASKSLTASLLLGRDGWESTVGTAQKLRNTVVNLLVAVLGGPDNNHLSMLLLKPLHMMNTFPVGFVFGELPGPEGYHFDCGCVLDQQGRASRNRPPLENTHLHFVNFCSWAMLSVGLLIFPQTRAQIQEVLTLRYIREVDPEGLSDVADVACSYAMNFALRCFECVGLCQQLPEDDRALCFFELFHRFRQRAVGLHPALARTFATSDTRHVYEDG